MHTGPSVMSYHEYVKLVQPTPQPLPCSKGCPLAYINRRRLCDFHNKKCIKLYWHCKHCRCSLCVADAVGAKSDLLEYMETEQRSSSGDTVQRQLTPSSSEESLSSLSESCVCETTQEDAVEDDQQEFLEIPASSEETWEYKTQSYNYTLSTPERPIYTWIPIKGGPIIHSVPKRKDEFTIQEEKHLKSDQPAQEYFVPTVGARLFTHTPKTPN